MVLAYGRRVSASASRSLQPCLRAVRACGCTQVARLHTDFITCLRQGRGRRTPWTSSSACKHAARASSPCALSHVVRGISARPRVEWAITVCHVQLYLRTSRPRWEAVAPGWTHSHTTRPMFSGVCAWCVRVYTCVRVRVRVVYCHLILIRMQSGLYAISKSRASPTTL